MTTDPAADAAIRALSDALLGNDILGSPGRVAHVRSGHEWLP